MTDFSTAQVAAVFADAPEPARAGLLRLRTLIMQVAQDIPEVTTLTEALRWGQPAYLPPTKVGTTIRLGLPKSGGFGLFTHCQTSVTRDFAETYPGWDKMDGARGVLFTDPTQIDEHRHSALIRSALTYHLR